MRTAMLITHLLGLTLGIGSSFIFIFTGMASSKLDKEDARKFMLNAFSLGTMGHIGLTLSLLSGFYLMTPFWAGLASMPLLISKLVFVGLFTLSIVFISIAQKKAKQDQSENSIKRIRVLSAISLFTGLAVVILAVLVFG